MSHANLFEEYRQLFKIDESLIEEWFPCGKDSIRVRFTDGKEVIWTLKGPENWSIESVEHFCKRVGGPEENDHAG
jgi:hypothetical protein